MPAANARDPPPERHTPTRPSLEGSVKPAAAYSPSIERPFPVSVVLVMKVPTVIWSSLDGRKAEIRAERVWNIKADSAHMEIYPA